MSANVTKYTLEIIKTKTSETIQVRAYGSFFDKGFTVIEYLPYPCKPKSKDVLRNIGVKAAKRMKTVFVDMTA